MTQDLGAALGGGAAVDQADRIVEAGGDCTRQDAKPSNDGGKLREGWRY